MQTLTKFCKRDKISGVCITAEVSGDAYQPEQVRRVRQLRADLPDGGDRDDPAIHRARIDAETCVECYQCTRGMSQERLNPTLVRAVRPALNWFRLRFDPEPDVCPTAAFEADELVWPRVVRRAFSDVTATHEVPGSTAAAPKR